MNCKKAKILIVAHVVGDLGAEPKLYHKLRKHLQSCKDCELEFEESRRVVSFIGEHRDEFAKAIETAQERQARKQAAGHAAIWQIRQQRWKKRAKIQGLKWKISSIAACVAIGISVWLIPLSPKVGSISIGQRSAINTTDLITIEWLIEDKKIAIPLGTQIRSSHNQLKTLIVNGKHKIVMNSDTTLSIEPKIENDQQDYKVKLSSGEIFVNIEHDGNLFVVSTTHGNITVTGTIFDVAVTNSSTTVVVIKGSVTFESERGKVKVSGGQVSEIFSQLAPTKPIPCNSAELTAWATDHNTDVSSGYHDFEKNGVAVPESFINLEDTDYDEWVEDNREWFRREFPWIFQLKKALAKEGIKAAYPKLLVESGDIWRFMYPETSPTRMCACNMNVLVTIAPHYGIDKQWLMENISIDQASLFGTEVPDGRLNSLDGLGEWANRLANIQKSQEEKLYSQELLYSLHAGTYIVKTRALIWLYLMNNKHNPKQEKAELSYLLKSQIDTAGALINKLIQLLKMEPDWECVNRSDLVDEIIKDITTLTGLEKRILRIR